MDTALGIAAMCLFCAASVAVCAVHWRRPWLFSSPGKCALWALGLSLWGWVLAGRALLVAVALGGPLPDNGAAVAFTLVFGWLYIWPFALPVFAAYALLRLAIAALQRRLRDGARDERTDGEE